MYHICQPNQLAIIYASLACKHKKNKITYHQVPMPGLVVGGALDLLYNPSPHRGNTRSVVEAYPSG